MNKIIEKNIPFMSWIIEVAEEKIIEHRLLKQKFSSHDEFIIFTIIWLRVYKKIYIELKTGGLAKKNIDLNISLDDFIKKFYKDQKDQYLGMTINAITRESLIPRSTVKRNIEKLISQKLLQRNLKNLIIPTSKVRDAMENYRKYIFKSNKKNYNLFRSLDLQNRYDEES